MTVGTPGVTDGVSYYRAAGPLGRLRQQMPNLQIDYPSLFGWHDFKACDIFFCHRPGSADHEKIIALAKDCGTPVWVEMDDDLLDVPMWNPGWETFRDKQAIVINCLKMADVVTTATELLAKKLRAYNPNVIVIPNALDESLLKGYDPICKTSEVNKVYWRGAPGHVKDLMMVQDDIVAIANEHPEIHWQFHGFWPWFLIEPLRQLKKDIKVDHIKTFDVIEYFHFLKKGASHSLAIVPLEDIPWNQMKSNIAWLENTLAGACTLALDTQEFMQPGCITYQSGMFKEAMLHIIGLSDKERKDRVQTSLHTIEQSFTLSKINKLRIDVIESLLTK